MCYVKPLDSESVCYDGITESILTDTKGTTEQNQRVGTNRHFPAWPSLKRFISRLSDWVRNGLGTSSTDSMFQVFR